MANNIPFGITEKALLEQIRAESEDAGNDLVKLEAFYQKYKNYADEYERGILEDRKIQLTEEELQEEQTKMTEEIDPEISRIVDLREIDYDKYEKSMHEYLKKLETPEYVVVKTINYYRILQGEPILGSDPDDNDDDDDFSNWGK